MGSLHYVVNFYSTKEMMNVFLRLSVGSNDIIISLMVLSHLLYVF